MPTGVSYHHILMFYMYHYNGQTHNNEKSLGLRQRHYFHTVGKVKKMPVGVSCHHILMFYVHITQSVS